MEMLIAYQDAAKTLDKTLLAHAVIPELWKLAIDPVLNSEQVMSVINALVYKVHANDTFHWMSNRRRTFERFTNHETHHS